MKYIKTDKKFTVSTGSGTNKRTIEIKESEFPQYDSFEDAFTSLGGEEKSLEYFNAVIRADSAGAAKVAALAKDCISMPEADVIALVQGKRKNFIATQSGRSGVSKETAADLGKKILAGFESGTMSPEQIMELIAAAKAA